MGLSSIYTHTHTKEPKIINDLYKKNIFCQKGHTYTMLFVFQRGMKVMASVAILDMLNFGWGYPTDHISLSCSLKSFNHEKAFRFARTMKKCRQRAKMK